MSFKHCSITCVVLVAWLSFFAGSSRAAPLSIPAAQYACPCSLWDDTTLPAVPDTGEALPVELGVKFRSSEDGYITGLRFYKSAANTGTHIGSLWANDGTLLAQATFTGESASGWQEVMLAAPVSIISNTTYVASYHTTTGHWSRDSSYFAASGYSHAPLYALANSEDAIGNGVYVYDPPNGAGGFPNQSWASTNYWVDVVFNTTVTDTTPPTVVAVSPADGATDVSIFANVTTQFSEPISPTTISASTFELRDLLNNLVPASLAYSAAARTATLDPASALAPSSSYTATITGGASGVQDMAGNPLAADYAWSFTTAAPPPDEGPGGPILIVANAANPFGRYYGEILRTEGFNAFTVTDISRVTAQTLAAYDVVVLGETPLSSAQVTLLDDWVTAGGNLIAMRPDKQLAGLLGLTDASSTLSDAYLLVNTASAPGAGIVNTTIQFHSTADLYDLNGATAAAMLYSNATTPTVYPAVTLRSVGGSGGQAAAFTYDLARSVVYTRQGNPAWAGVNRDATGPAEPRIIAEDMFYPDWIDFNKITIPQADEQQRLLANLILHMNRDKKPLPRFWYFPRDEKAVVIMTGDDHGNGGTAGRFDIYLATSPAGCSVADWECIRASSYIWTNALLTDTQAANYDAEGFEIGWHINTGCVDWTPASLASLYATQLTDWHNAYPSLPPQVSVRTHCVNWSDWATQPKVELSHGIRLDTNYYYYPPAWVLERPGLFTGSGMPMRFADLDGATIDVYQAVTQMTDESSGVGYGYFNPIHITTLLDNAVGPNGYYGAFTANMHTDSASHAGSDTIVSAALARSVPIVSSRQMLEWLDGRNGSSFRSLAWSGDTLSFEISVGAGARGLRAMVPTQSIAGILTELRFNGDLVTPTLETIKGIEYAFFAGNAGTYQAHYEPDAIPPVISGVLALPRTDGTAAITWSTNEASDTRVDYGAAPDTLDLHVSDAALVAAHSITLTGLTPNATYYYRVGSADVWNNLATYPSGAPLSFVVPSAAFVDTTFADFSAGLPDANVHVHEAGGGEVSLAPLVATEFSGSILPSGWFVAQYPSTGSGGTAIVSGGVLTLDGVRVGTDAMYTPGHSLEFVATFTDGLYKHVGFGTDFDAGPWAIFSTDSSTGTTLQARTNPSGYASTDTTIPGSWLGAPHRYRIDWSAGNVVYSIDGAPVVTHAIAIAIADPMRPMAAEYLSGGSTLTVDWLRMSPYQTPGVFLSRVFDAIGTATWGSATWTCDVPVSASLSLSARTGNTPVPDGTWTAFAALAGQGAPVGASSRYIQYRADMTTSDSLQTPVLFDVTIGFYNVIPDTTPPTITARSPSPVATDVALDSNVTVRFSEAMNSSTINTTSFRLRASGASSDVPAVVSYSGITATLDPISVLAPNRIYQVTVSGTVADLSNNLLGADDTWTFKTTPDSLFTDTTVDDFGAGSTDAGSYIAQTANGEVMLAPAVGAEFSGSALPADWFTVQYPIGGSGGTAVVNNGELTVDGVRVGTNATFGPGHSLELVATFTAGLYKHVGFGVDWQAPPWAIFSTDSSTGTTLQARTHNGAIATDQTLPGNWLGAPHRYRVDWTDTQVVYSIDSTAVATHTIAISAPMRPMAADYAAGGNVVTLDWMRMTPFQVTGVFTSRVYYAGGLVDWLDLSWIGSQPAGTTVGFETRSGDTPLPDGSWSAWQMVNSPIASPNSGYFQYRMNLGTTDAQASPVVESVTVTFSYQPTSVRLVSFRATERQPLWQSGWRWLLAHFGR